MPIPMPNPEELALQNALGGEAPPEEESMDPEGQEMEILMQLISELKATGDPKIMALLDQLMALQQTPEPPSSGAEIGPSEE